jgi:hypothetical protein
VDILIRQRIGTDLLELVLPHTDAIVAIESGKVLMCGTYSDIEGQLQNSSGFKSPSLDMKVLHPAAQSHDKQIPSGEVILHQVEQSPIDSVPQKKKGNWYSYIYYARSAGSLNLLLWAFFTLVSAITTSYTSKLYCHQFMEGISSRFKDTY